MNDKDIKQVFENMTPDAEAEARMLACILAAKEQKDESQDGTSRRSQSASTSAPAKKRFAWTIAIPLAAALVVLVGVGVFTALSFSPNVLEPIGLGESNMKNFSQSTESSGNRDCEDNEADQQSDSSADSGLAYLFPLIEFEGTGRLFIAQNDTGEAIRADVASVGEELGEGKALGEDGTRSHACTIYRYSNTDILRYAVKYDGDDSYYLAAPLAR